MTVYESVTVWLVVMVLVTVEVIKSAGTVVTAFAVTVLSLTLSAHAGSPPFILSRLTLG